MKRAGRGTRPLPISMTWALIFCQTPSAASVYSLQGIQQREDLIAELQVAEARARDACSMFQVGAGRWAELLLPSNPGAKDWLEGSEGASQSTFVYP